MSVFLGSSKILGILRVYTIFALRYFLDYFKGRRPDLRMDFCPGARPIPERRPGVAAREELRIRMALSREFLFDTSGRVIQ